MALEFQFAFLGPDHIYVAWVTKTSSSGCPQDTSSVEFYRPPKAFCEQFRKRLALPRYIYNVRGHDFLSFVGQWKSASGDGPLDTNQNLYNEIDDLRKFTSEEVSKCNRAANPIATFGPCSNSFFVDSFRLKQYRWKNLPFDLEDEIQDILCVNGWVEKGKGKIWDVAISANGGWVLVLNQGKDWRMGGPLDETLRTALVEGQRNGASIARIFLNHQNPTEYVLLFSTGIVHARLHAGFEIQLQELLKAWSEARLKRNKSFGKSEWFNFTASSVIDKDEQQKRIAAYYARRGLFHHTRGSTLLAKYLRDAVEQRRHSLSIEEQCVRNLVLAHKYLREANKLQPNNLSIQQNYVESLKGVRSVRYDPILEERLCCVDSITRKNSSLSGDFHGEEDDKKEFRNEYVWAIGMLRRLGSEGLAKELEVGRTHAIDISLVSAARSGWSYVMATSEGPFAIEEIESTVEPQTDASSNWEAISIAETGIVVTEYSVHSLPLKYKPFQTRPHSPPIPSSFRPSMQRSILEFGLPLGSEEIDRRGPTTNEPRQ